MESLLISTSSRFLLEERIGYLSCFTHFTQGEYVFYNQGGDAIFETQFLLSLFHLY